ncbi:MAG TPA: hypothetical protein VNO18_21955 [Xanthobacteraceae bacterium]|nr:hypothetical protein [Xanthobacteraceae bacterium]
MSSALSAVVPGLDRHRGDRSDHAQWVGQWPIGQIRVTRQNNW